MSPMPNFDLKTLFSRFHKQFWVVNTFELFERGAYYGMMAIFVFHFSKNVGMEYEVVGLALAMLMPLLYFTPLIASALAEKYGYKPAFIISFILIMIGYMLLYYVDSVPGLLMAIVSLGIGAGAFKPMVSATIAHVVTDHRDRNYAYSIYYWMINLGAFIFPLGVGFYVENILGSLKFASAAFPIATFFIGVNTVICFLVFEEPIQKKRDKRIVKALWDLGLIFKDRTFLVLLIIYSGFWFMFALDQSFLPIYLYDFGLIPDGFSIFWVASINPGTIIIFGPFLSKMVDKISDRFSSLQLMITGMSIFILGLLIIAFGKTFLLASLGTVVFSVGEFLTHPNFISYVSKIAPKDKVAIYMGYAFIPIGIGYSIGTAASGFLYGAVARDMLMPSIFWSIVASTGILTVSAFLIYNLFFMIRPKKRREREKALKEGRPWSPPRSTISSKMFTSRIVPVAIVFLIPMFLVAAVNMGTDEWFGDVTVVEEGSNWSLVGDSLDPVHGSSTENSETQKTINISKENIVNVTFTLTWTDEPDPGISGIARVNKPDEFSIMVETPDDLVGEEGPASNPQGGEGSVSVTITRDGSIKNMTKDTAMGDYIVTIKMGNAGDNELGIGFGPSTGDNGNSWTLDIDYDFYQKAQGPMSQ